MCTVIRLVMNLRSSGLFEALRSRYGAKMSKMRPMPGMVTPAIIGWNIVSNSCRPMKYHGAFDGFGVWLKLAACNSGALTNHENMNVNAVHARAATNSMESKCGQTCTLSTGTALTSWMEPDFTTVSSRCVWPPGPAPTGTPPAEGAATTGADGASFTATPPARAALLRSSNSDGIRDALSPPPAVSPPVVSDFSRAALARLRRCSGISVIVAPVLCSQRS